MSNFKLGKLPVSYDRWDFLFKDYRKRFSSFIVKQAGDCSPAIK
jgi:hypothetical protein